MGNSRLHLKLNIMNPQVWSMDSPIISRLFRQLFTHRSCQSVRSHSSLPFRIHNGRRTGVRYSSSKGDGGEKPKQDSLWQPRRDAFPEDMSAEYAKYPMVTADQLRGRRERPRRVKMLTRDFIEGMYTICQLSTKLTQLQIHCTIPHMATSRSK